MGSNKSFVRFGASVLGTLMFLNACGDDDGGTGGGGTGGVGGTGGTGDVCAGVDCGSEGQCVESAGQAACDCNQGHHAEGLTCVPDASNTAPEITSTPSLDAMELVPYEYEVTCTDADGDALTLALGSADTCGGSLVDDGDGTGAYSFTPPAVEADDSCTLAITCQDASDEDSQEASITIHDVPPCEPEPTFVGQVDGSTDPSSSHGGVLTTTPWDPSYDAGIAALLALVPATPGDSADVNVPLTEATIVATYAATSQERMYLADGNGNIRTYLSEEATQIPSFLPKVGSKVSVTVIEVTNYEGMAEISKVADSSWILDSSQNEVVVSDHTGGPALTSGDFSKLVRVAGTVTSEGISCGGTAFCHDFDYGAGQSTVFRHWGGMNAFPIGTCITFIGPVTGFQNEPQVTMWSGDWVWTNE